MIKYIIHISDIHVRTNKYHELYEEQFNLLYDEINNFIKSLKLEPWELRLVITGDLVHNKLNISNEQILLLSRFLNKISKLLPIIIIPGNHDFLENNMERLDSITPIIEMLDNSNIKYFKDMGVYEDDNVNWIVYSLYQHNERPNFIYSENKKHIGLFHGSIQGLSTDFNYTFDETSYNPNNFIGLDFILCGDIHKHQKFSNNNVNGVMIGSLIQQGFGETVKYHGYGILNLENYEYNFHELKNNKPFLHFSISDIEDIENNKEILINLQ